MGNEFLNMFTLEERNKFCSAVKQTGKKHPLKQFLTSQISYLGARLDQTVKLGLHTDPDFDSLWARLASRMLDEENLEDAASAISEFRVYGDFLESGFEVKRVNETNDNSTPDYIVAIPSYFKSGGGIEIEVEVASKLESPRSTEMYKALDEGKRDPNISENKITMKNAKILTRTAEDFPAGQPDTNKINSGVPRTESVQTNFISKICAIKQKEKQFSTEKPSILWIDLFDFSKMPSFIKADAASPIESWQGELVSGGLWHAIYGEKGDPVFEGGRTTFEGAFRMGHNGRFWSKNTSKLSAICIAVSDGVIIFENPISNNPLPQSARQLLSRLPKINLYYSHMDIVAGSVSRRINDIREELRIYDQLQEGYYRS